MLRLYHSNDLEILKELLVHQMQQGDPDPFLPEQILVQSQGMAHWLKLNLSSSLGIAANLDFPLPSSFVWKIYNAVKPDLPERSHFEKSPMTWKLMRLLPELIEEPVFAPVAHYLEGDTSGLKCFELAENIADTFDQYLIYRPDWILNWEAGLDDIEGGDISLHAWQPELWRRLVKDSDGLGHSLFHRARLTDQLTEIVRKGHKGLKTLFPHQKPRIFVFGIAALPGAYWNVLQAISEYIDVHYFLLNPCRNFWGDLITEKARLKLLQRDPAIAEYFTGGNPLLASWGKNGRDFITLVHETAELADNPVQDVDAFADNEKHDLLHRVRQDILTLQDSSQIAFSPEALQSSEQKQLVRKDDSSIRFVSAHSPLREVQILHDQILGWFDQDEHKGTEKALQPRDIVVMVPDIDIYGPYIEAVFGSAPDHLRVPWAIADQAMSRENPVIDSFLKLLMLPDSRFTVSDAMALLEVPAIGEQFGISAAELDSIKPWLVRANIRWGLDGEHRQDLNLPGWEENSWLKGLKQLLLGLAMPDSGVALDHEWPVASIEGAQSELYGRLVAFIDRIGYWRGQMGIDGDAEHWHGKLQKLISDFYPVDSVAGNVSDQLVIQTIRDRLQEWTEELQQSAFTDSLSHSVVLRYLRKTLGKQVGWQRFLAGPVNFCTLMPMRSIPFRVICMLGMNDEDYPRRVPPQGFDLMAQGRYRRGDRSRREDDRYLFLEALCSAQDRLYISYRGRDNRENNELQPCVLVSELIDYIANSHVLEGDQALPHSESAENIRQWLIAEHALQPFNSAYFREDDSSQSYQPVWASVAALSSEAAENDENIPGHGFSTDYIPDNRETHIRQNPDLDDLKEFLMNPARFFMRRRLKVNLNLYWEDTRDDEIFLPDALMNYQFLHGLIQSMLDDNAQEYIERQKAAGNLPAAALADHIIRQGIEKVQPLADELLQLMPERHFIPPSTHTIDIGDYQLSGQLDKLVSNMEHQSQVHYRSGSLHGAVVMNLWLDHVFACASEKPVQFSTGLGLSKTGTEQIRFDPVPQQRAKEILSELVTVSEEGYQSPQPFFPKLAWKYVNTPEEKRSKILSDELNAEISELHDPDVQRCFGADVADSDFIGKATVLWEKILAPLNEFRHQEDPEELQ